MSLYAPPHPHPPPHTHTLSASAAPSSYGNKGDGDDDNDDEDDIEIGVLEDGSDQEDGDDDEEDEEDDDQHDDCDQDDQDEVPDESKESERAIGQPMVIRAQPPSTVVQQAAQATSTGDENDPVLQLWMKGNMAALETQRKAMSVLFFQLFIDLHFKEYFTQGKICYFYFFLHNFTYLFAILIFPFSFSLWTNVWDTASKRESPWA
jgi:hypothetical protein